jgi:hypothetical protein
MQIIYWAHSYREEDAAINKHFGVLIEQAERMIVNFDPPSKTVNSAKLSQNLRSSDGMIAVLSWRANGPSQYILYEIGLSLSARKPVIVFVDDRLPDNILPARILQRRFSYRTYFRQFREHTASLRTLKTYLGDPPPTRYQPNFGKRICGLIGLSALREEMRREICNFVEWRFYSLIDLDGVQLENPLEFDSYEYLSNLDLAIICVDSASLSSIYWSGAITAAAIPMITLTHKKDFKFNMLYPKEFQPRIVGHGFVPTLKQVLDEEFELYEQNFLSVDNPEAIARYTRMQVEAGELAGNYEAGTRRKFMEVIMGDQYNVSGQAGAVGPNAHAHDMTFSQVWNKLEGNVDLAQLAGELGRLQKEMEQRATESAQKLAAGAIAAAAQSAQQKDGPKVVEYLKMAGSWALDVAQQIGVEVAKVAITGALGLG